MYALGGGYGKGGEGIDHGGVGMEDVAAVVVEERMAFGASIG